MMEEKDNKELIDRMAEVLRNHSGSYKVGAWERFSGAKRPAKGILPWAYLSGAAAMILLGLTLYILQKPTGGEVRKGIPAYTQGDSAMPNKKEAPIEQAEKKPLKPDLITAGSPRIASRDGRENLSLKIRETPFSAEKELMGGGNAVVIESEKIALQSPAASLVAASKLEEREQDAAGGNAVDREAALLRMLSEESGGKGIQARAKQTDRSGRKWDVGVVLAPSMTDVRVNMGGGVLVAYRVNKKLSIASGVSMVDLGVQGSPGSSSGGGAFADPVVVSLSSQSPLYTAKSVESKVLTSFNSNVLGLDIPIDFRYQVTDHWYASAGVSLFTVLNEQRTNNYVTQTPTAERAIQNDAGFAYSQPEFVVQSVSEKSSETPLQGNNYSGFLNFSVGRKVPISSKVGLSVEPFFKQPVGKLSNDRVNLRYGGIRIITSF